MNKKIIKGVLAYLILIIVLVIYVIIRVGVTFNLTKIMPSFDTNIYSKANMLPFDLNINISARNQINKQLDRVKDDVYGEREYVEKGLREILILNRNSLDEYIASFSETKRNDYLALNNVEYLDYIKQKEFHYNNKTRQNILSIYLYPKSAIDKGLYYEVQADFYKPVIIQKQDVKLLNVGDNFNVEYKISTRSEIIELTYIGDNRFKHSYLENIYDEKTNGVKQETLQVEFSLKELNNSEYALYQGQTQRLEIFDSRKNVNILKDAIYCNAYGSNFLYVSNVVLIDEEKGSSLNNMVRFDDFVKDILVNVSTESNAKLNINEDEIEDIESYYEIDRIFNAIYINYIVYDNKGYITDLYTFNE